MPQLRWAIERAVLVRPSPAGFLRLMLQSDTAATMTQACKVEVVMEGDFTPEIFEEDPAAPRAVQGRWIALEIKPRQIPSIVLRLCPDDATLEARIRMLTLCVGSDRIELRKQESGIFKEDNALLREAMEAN